jgi:endonuclease/exonuclease/phosphatase family metal-dependent hydrolase
MRLRTRHLFTALALGAVMSLGGAAAATASSGQGHDAHGTTIAVETYNVNLGADLSLVFKAQTLPALVTAAGDALKDVAANDFPSRAVALAKVIARAHPDVIGLQEVATWRLSTTGKDGPWVTNLDYLDLLQRALVARGLPYTVVSKNESFTGVAPVSADYVTWAQYVDQNLILVRTSRLASLRPSGANQAKYVAKLSFTLPAPLGSLAVTRGWASVDLKLGDQRVRFFDTHLEAYDDAVRATQATELTALVKAAGAPVLVVGDMNSRPVRCSDVPGYTEAYKIIAAAGLHEVWPAVHPRHPCAGFTSDTDNRWPASLNHRIDHIFFSRAFTALDTWVVGNVPSVRTPSGLWPSDHASSVAVLALKSMHDHDH